MPAPKGHPPYPGCETGGRPKEWTDERIEAEADAFLIWAQKDDSIVLRGFANHRGFPPQHLSKWAKENKKFREAYAIARSIVGVRREEGALNGKLDTTIVRISMATYDAEHKSMLLELKNADNDAKTQKAITYLLRGQMMREEREERDRDRDRDEKTSV